MSTMPAASAATPAASGFWSRARAAFSSVAAPTSGDLPEKAAVRNALFDSDGRLMRASSTDLATLPEGVLELRLALEAKIHRMADKRAKADADFKKIMSAEPEAAYRLITADADADITKAFDDVYGTGKVIPNLSKEWQEYRDKIVERGRAAGVIPMEFFTTSATNPGASTSATSSAPSSKAAIPSSGATTPPAGAPGTPGSVSTPAASTASPAAGTTASTASSVPSKASASIPAAISTGINWSDLSSVDSETLLLDLADGLEYDRFDSVTFRSKLFGKAVVPTVQELIVMCTTYIFVGNNTTRLTNKVKNQKIGERALAVCNRFGVMRTKADSSTVTLARIGIAFSPVVWALRSELEKSKRLSAAGVITSTPVVLQDVALSGVSNRIDGGAAIDDFLIKFNRVLSEAAEKGKQTKSTEADRDATAKKFHDVSLTGAARDPVLQAWDFNRERSISSVEKFYAQLFSTGT